MLAKVRGHPLTKHNVEIAGEPYAVTTSAITCDECGASLGTCRIVAPADREPDEWFVLCLDCETR